VLTSTSSFWWPGHPRTSTKRSARPPINVAEAVLEARRSVLAPACAFGRLGA
jgi:hypothetical protein